MFEQNHQRFKLAIAVSALGLLAALVPDTVAAGSAAHRYDISGDVTGMESAHRARLTANAPGKGRRSVTMMPDGSFTFRSLAPGKYTIRPSHRYYTFAPTYRNITVGRHNVDSVHFRAHPAVKKSKR